MTYKIKDIISSAKEKNISEKKVKDFFNTGLKLGFFKVVGNESDNLIYETCNPGQATSNTTLLNEEKKNDAVQPKGSVAAPVGNKVTSGWSNPFAGTSWGK